MNKFKEVSSYVHQMSLAGFLGWAGRPRSEVQGGWGSGDPRSDIGAGGGCTVKSNASWVMVTRGPPVNRQARVKHYLPATSLTVGVKIQNANKVFHLKFQSCRVSMKVNKSCFPIFRNMKSCEEHESNECHTVQT